MSANERANAGLRAGVGISSFNPISIKKTRDYGVRVVMSFEPGSLADIAVHAAVAAENARARANAHPGNATAAEEAADAEADANAAARFVFRSSDESSSDEDAPNLHTFVAEDMKTWQYAPNHITEQFKVGNVYGKFFVANVQPGVLFVKEFASTEPAPPVLVHSSPDGSYEYFNTTEEDELPDNNVRSDMQPDRAYLQQTDLIDQAQRALQEANTRKRRQKIRADAEARAKKQKQALDRAKRARQLSEERRLSPVTLHVGDEICFEDPVVHGAYAYAQVMRLTGDPSMPWEFDTHNDYISQLFRDDATKGVFISRRCDRMKNAVPGADDFWVWDRVPVTPSTVWWKLNSYLVPKENEPPLPISDARARTQKYVKEQEQKIDKAIQGMMSGDTAAPSSGQFSNLRF